MSNSQFKGIVVHLSTFNFDIEEKWLDKNLIHVHQLNDRKRLEDRSSSKQ